jgi:hypothetical protein
VGQILSSELGAFVESGISIQVGVADARARPDGCRCLGVKVAPDRGSLTVYAPFPTLGEIRRCLAENPRVSVVFSRPADHRTIQVKGHLLEVRDAVEADREHVERYRALATETFASIGIPARVFLAVVTWPALAIRFQVDDVFVATPGPGAGARLVPAPAEPAP